MDDEKRTGRSKFHLASGEDKSALVADVTGQHNTRRTAVVCGTVVLSILSVAIVVAIFRDPDIRRDYVGMILPVISGALLGAGGYFAGKHSKND